MKGWKDDPILGKAGAPAIDIRPGSGAPARLMASDNPFSAGFYPLGRIYTVGDVARLRESDALTGVEKRIYGLHVTLVDHDADRVEFNQGRNVTDLMGNTLKAGDVEFDAPVQFSPAHIQVGKKWRAAFIRTKNDKSSNAFYDIQIVRRETVVVPAGTFDAFKLEALGWNMTFGSRLEVNIWLVPGLIVPVKREWFTRNKKGHFSNTERHELISLRQQAIGI